MQKKDNDCKYDGILYTLNRLEEKIAKLQEGVIKLRLKLSSYDDKILDKDTIEHETEGEV
jgi:hypothetical protein